MDNSQMVFCKVEDINLMNEENEEDKTIEFEDIYGNTKMISKIQMEELWDRVEGCEYCLGAGIIEAYNEEYDCEYIDCEYCDIYDLSNEESDNDNESDYIPDWSEDNDTDEDTISLDSFSEESDCGGACNDKVCFCGSV